MPWYVVCTKPKTEIKTAKRLEKMGIDVFCPVQEEIRQWSDRKKKFTVPLFNSYVFVRLEEKNRASVFDVPGVNNFLFWLGKPAVVRENEIEVIKNWLEDDLVSEVILSDLKPGDQLRIKNGAFKDKEATIQEVGKRKCKLILKNLGIVLEAKISEAFMS